MYHKRRILRTCCFKLVCLSLAERKNQDTQQLLMFPENKEKSLEMLFRQASKSFLVFDIPGELLSLNRSNHVPNLPQVSFQSGQVWCNESVVILTYVIVTLMFFLGFLFFHTLVLSSSMVWFTPLLPPHPTHSLFFPEKSNPFITLI